MQFYFANKTYSTILFIQIFETSSILVVEVWKILYCYSGFHVRNRQIILNCLMAKEKKKLLKAVILWHRWFRNWQILFIMTHADRASKPNAYFFWRSNQMHKSIQLSLSHIRLNTYRTTRWQLHLTIRKAIMVSAHTLRASSLYRQSS